MRLKVAGLKQMPKIQSMFEMASAPEQEPLLLPNVSILDTSFDLLAINRSVSGHWNVWIFARMLSKLREIDFSYMTIDFSFMINRKAWYVTCRIHCSTMSQPAESNLEWIAVELL
jgi:hypothetical protein